MNAADGASNSVADEAKWQSLVPLGMVLLFAILIGFYYLFFVDRYQTLHLSAKGMAIAEPLRVFAGISAKGAMVWSVTSVCVLVGLILNIWFVVFTIEQRYKNLRAAIKESKGRLAAIAMVGAFLAVIYFVSPFSGGTLADEGTIWVESVHQNFRLNWAAQINNILTAILILALALGNGLLIQKSADASVDDLRKTMEAAKVMLFGAASVLALGIFQVYSLYSWNSSLEKTQRSILCTKEELAKAKAPSDPKYIADFQYCQSFKSKEADVTINIDEAKGPSKKLVFAPKEEETSYDQFAKAAPLCLSFIFTIFLSMLFLPLGMALQRELDKQFVKARDSTPSIKRSDWLDQQGLDSSPPLEGIWKNAAILLPVASGLFVKLLG
jgi:hypothetical protein